MKRSEYQFIITKQSDLQLTIQHALNRKSSEWILRINRPNGSCGYIVNKELAYSMKLIINILITAVVAYFLAKLLSPHVAINTMETAIIFAIILAILNFILKPLLVLLTLPITIITLGLFLLVINVIIVMLADKFVPGIKIESFLWAFVFGLILSVVTSILHKLT